jgi:hypothetical protein
MPPVKVDHCWTFKLSTSCMWHYKYLISNLLFYLKNLFVIQFFKKCFLVRVFIAEKNSKLVNLKLKNIFNLFIRIMLFILCTLKFDFMKKHLSLYVSLVMLSILSISAMFFLNSIEDKKLVMDQKIAANNQSVKTESMSADSTDYKQTANLKRAKQDNYLPNVTILNYVIQKGIESLPVLRLKDFIPLFNGKQS